MRAMGQEVKSLPEFPNDDTVMLRVDLIEEELAELLIAIENSNITNVADALADLLYVVYGTGAAFGINLNDVFKEVHDSNMSKVLPDGSVLKREDGKILKPEGYFPPNINKILDDQSPI